MSLRDDDDLHPGLAVRASVLSGARFASAAVLGDAARITLATSATRFRARTKVVGVAANSDGSTTLALDDDTTVQASRAIFCTGYGVPRDDPGARAGVDAPIVNAARVLAHASRHALPHAWTATAARTLAVVGAGPSALSVWALALGFGPHEELEVPGKLARFDPRRISTHFAWITGAHGPASALEARARMRAAAPHTMPFVIQQAIAPVLDELVQLEAAGRLQVVRGRAAWSDVNGGARVDVAPEMSGTSTTIYVERAVLATGFVSMLPRLWGAPSLRALIDSGRAQARAVVGGAPHALEIDGALIFGAALEELVPQVFEEPPFAGAFVHALPIVDALPRPRASTAKRARAMVTLAPGKTRTRARVRVEAAARAESSAFAAWTNALDVRLALASFDLRELGTRTVEVTLRGKGPRARALDVEVRGLSASSAQALAHALPQRLRRAARRWGKVTVDVDLKNGRLP